MKSFNILLSITNIFLAQSSGEIIPKVVGYYVPWGNTAPKDLPYDKLTHINFAFGGLNLKTPGVIDISSDYHNKIIQVIEFSRSKGTKALISIGGWTNSKGFSLSVKKENRKLFIKNLINLVKPTSYGFDGIDLDWEYPGRAGDTEGLSKFEISQLSSNEDKKNFLDLITELKIELVKHFPNNTKLITAAVNRPSDYEILPNIRFINYANHLDFINLMTYDLSGSWDSKINHGAPINRISNLIESWKKSGFPSYKMNLGLPFYGFSRVTLNQTQVSNIEQDSLESQCKQKSPGDLCLNKSERAFTYKELRENMINDDGQGINGYEYRWDSEAQVPWLYNPKSQLFISYDNPTSIKIKLDLVSKYQLGGVMIWENTQDYKHELINVISANLKHQRRIRKCIRRKKNLLVKYQN